VDYNTFPFAFSQERKCDFSWWMGRISTDTYWDLWKRLGFFPAFLLMVKIQETLEYRTMGIIFKSIGHKTKEGTLAFSSSS
jgi:hypothetical protein